MCCDTNLHNFISILYRVGLLVPIIGSLFLYLLLIYLQPLSVHWWTQSSFINNSFYKDVGNMNFISTNKYLSNNCDEYYRHHKFLTSTHRKFPLIISLTFKFALIVNFRACILNHISGNIFKCKPMQRTGKLFTSNWRDETTTHKLLRICDANEPVRFRFLCCEKK